MTGHEHDPSDLEALHGQRVEVEEIDLLEDADGIPSWIKVERKWASVAISPLLLGPRTRDHTPATPTPTPEPERAPQHRKEGVAS